VVQLKVCFTVQKSGRLWCCPENSKHWRVRVYRVRVIFVSTVLEAFSYGPSSTLLQNVLLAAVDVQSYSTNYSQTQLPHSRISRTVL